MWLNFNLPFSDGTAMAFGNEALTRPSVSLRPAVFVDKDGTLIEDRGDTADPAQLHFLPGAGAALATLAQAGFALVVVTNQSGIARGHFSRADFASLQAALYRRLHEEFGVALTDLMLCPHAPGRNGAPACLCRKPAPGLLIRAARAHRLDLAQSWIVGDTLDDIEAGHRAGCRAIMLDRGGETAWRRSPLREPDAQFTHWDEVTQKLLAVASRPAVPSADARPS